MKIWRLRADVDHYANFTTNPIFSHEAMQCFDGRPHNSAWKPLELECIDDNPLPLGDAVGFDIGLLISNEARQLFSKLDESAIEYLPVHYSEHIYYLMNVLGTIDCLDHQKSVCLYSPTTKDRILFVNKYHFNESIIGERKVFRLKDEPYRGPFVTEEVVSAIRSLGLKGFCFELVWDGSDHPGRKVSFDGVLSVEY